MTAQATLAVRCQSHDVRCFPVSAMSRDDRGPRTAPLLRGLGWDVGDVGDP